jgi:hypothetical protein
MNRFTRWAKWLALVLAGATLTGCVVLPFGGGRGHYERGERHHYSPDGGQRGEHSPRGR